MSGRFALAGLRAHAAAHELLARLAPAERERLYATLASARDTARPTGDGAVDEALRAWARDQQCERRGDTAGPGITVELPPRKPRETWRSTTVVEPPGAPEGECTPSVPADPEEQRRRSEAALRRLEEAEAAAEAANERVLAALDKLGL